MVEIGRKKRGREGSREEADRNEKKEMGNQESGIRNDRNVRVRGKEDKENIFEEE